MELELPLPELELELELEPPELPDVPLFEPLPLPEFVLDELPELELPLPELEPLLL